MANPIEIKKQASFSEKSAASISKKYSYDDMVWPEAAAPQEYFYDAPESDFLELEIQ